ncbi:MAG: substrate-binding domain-containing protein, partial [Opitutaceae bacterium]|nr:substrate-binding domain-containing protein [Opitutaceae bacterium]
KNNDDADASAPNRAERLVVLQPSASFSVRYLGVIVACGYTMLVALIAICLPIGQHGLYSHFGEVFIWAHCTSMFFPGDILLFFRAPPWPYFIPPLMVYAVYAAGMAWEFRVMRTPCTRWPGRVVLLAAAVVCTAAFALRVAVLESGVFRESDGGTRMDDTIYTKPYVPFVEDNKLVKISAPTLAITSDHPRLDGATALYPVYAAAAQAVYKNIDAARVRQNVSVSTTPRAYERLVSGEADVIFCAKPSPAQVAAAREKCVEFQLTPLGREAFVFFVNEANPVDALTSAQVRAIYTREITNWSGVGGNKEKILPFQRPKDSGSQTAMEHQVMQGRPMATPLLEEQMRGMGETILEAAAYRNSANAIGYSFRFFVTTMTGIHGVKLLRIDGVAPTVETIRSGAYPYAGNLYAVTANKTADNPRVRELIAWFLSPQGQQLIEDAGYVPLEEK